MITCFVVLWCPCYIGWMPILFSLWRVCWILSHGWRDGAYLLLLLSSDILYAKARIWLGETYIGVDLIIFAYDCLSMFITIDCNISMWLHAIGWHAYLCGTWVITIIVVPPSPLSPLQSSWARHLCQWCFNIFAIDASRIYQPLNLALFSILVGINNNS